jgi:GNAT superfamily N-acetyltransferase
MAAVRIRNICGAADFDLLLELQRACLPSDKPYDTARGWWWVAFTAADVPVAFAGLTETYADPWMGYLCRAGVVPEARGAGLQKRLIRTRLRLAKSLGMRSVVTDTAHGNHASANSLIATGFRMYQPAQCWAAPGAHYWRRIVC